MLYHQVFTVQVDSTANKHEPAGVDGMRERTLFLLVDKPLLLPKALS